MTPERWQQVERVCQEALDLAPCEREALLDRACGGDAELRREVESLLAQQQDAERLLGTSAWDAAAEALGHGTGAPRTRMVRGQRLGPFEIEGLAGIGGMGEIYRARDTRLGRTVAVKVLPPDAAADPDRRRRLETEARAASALSHPNICALFDVGSDGGIDYLVMEYLEGETLAARMARPLEADPSPPPGLPLGEALAYGAQIAEALAAAHRAGIVHRDLKPGNVMLTPDGVKLLDFGLAKINPPFDTIDAATDGRGRIRTVSGVVMGTMNYMAPERLRGSGADARSDLFAFGALLYEMITGRRAFEGSSPVIVIPAILESEPPPLAGRQPLATPDLERLVRRCLVKDREQRWDSALLAAQELRRIAAELAGSDSVAAPAMLPVQRSAAPARAARRWLPWLVAASAVVVAAAAVGWIELRPVSPPGPMLRLELDLGRGFTAHPRSGHVALAPDGSRIVFLGVGADGAPDLFVRRFDRGGAMPLDTGGGGDLFFSPDGRWLGYFRGGRLWRIDLAGGRPLDVCAAPEITSTGADWGDGGFIVASVDSTGGLSRIPENGGAPVPLTTLDAGRGEAAHQWPQVLPGSEAVIFTSRARPGQPGGARVDALSLVTGRRTTLQPDAEFGRFLPSGHLVFVRRSTLFAVPMDAGRLALRGQPVPVLGPVLMDEERGRLHISASTAGDVLVLTGVWREAAGGEVAPGGAASGAEVTLLLRFFGELDRLAPVGR
jgi:eukaryotic-like serine/threonine-protein kinase